MKFFNLCFILSVIVITGISMNEADGQWTRMSGPYGYQYGSITAGNSNILAANSMSGGVYRSTDGGMHWVEADKGIWVNEIYCMGYYKQNFFASNREGNNNLLFISTDNGNNWSQVNTITPSEGITCFAGNDSVFFAGTYSEEVYTSRDAGLTWTKPKNNGLLHPVLTLVASGQNIFAGTDGGAVYKSTDNGDNWVHCTIPNYNTYVNSLFMYNNKLYMQSGENLYSTTDEGLTWSTVTTSAPTNTIFMVPEGSKIYAGTYTGLYVSTDNGQTWDGVGLYSAMIESLVFYNGNLIAGTHNVGIFTSQDDGATWQQTGAANNMMVQSLAAIGSNLVVANGSQDGVFCSTDNGETYTGYNNLNNSYVVCMKTRGSVIYAGTGKESNGEGGIFKSTDYGFSWNNLGLKDIIANCINYNSSYLFVGTPQGVFRTSNEGAIWSQVNNGIPASISAMATDDTILFAATNSGMYKTSDNGTNWTTYGLYDTVVSSLLKSGNILFAGNDHGLFKNNLIDTVWTPAAFTDTSIVFLTGNNNMIFAEIYADNKFELFASTNNGTTRNSVNAGMDNIAAYAAGMNDTYMFVGTWGEGVWRRPLSELVTGIAGKQNNFPSQFYLSQNYPNPFNPSTTIQYELPKSSMVVLKVYDVLGREVETLVNERQSPGIHSVYFNASGLNSGVYFYRLEAGQFSLTKKLMLIK